MSAEKAANDFDARLFGLADGAAYYAERETNPRRRELWLEAASLLFKARVPVRQMMSERDRKETA